jgi:uncharacterized protein (TIGR03435 family)
MKPLSIACLVLAAAGAQASAGQAQFDVASVKVNNSGERFTRMRPPAGGTFTGTNVTLQMLIVMAYKVKTFEISGGPAWMDAARYDVAAKTADSIVEEQFRSMLQALLAERFRLAAHRETRTMAVYSLTAAKGGLKLPNANPSPCSASGLAAKAFPEQPAKACGAFGLESTLLEGRTVAMPMLTNGLSTLLGRPIVDHTGYTGTFDVELQFAPLENSASGANTADSTFPSLFTALQEQLGLKLEAQRGPAEILVIDHAEKPGEN